MDEFVRRPKRPRITIDRVEPRRPRPAASQAENPPVLPQPPESNQESSKLMPRQTRKKRRLPHLPWPPKTKKQIILFTLSMLLLLGAGGGAIYWFVLRNNPAPVAQVEPQPEPEPEPEPVPTTAPSKLSGREVQKSVNDRQVYAVQIENSPEARPQSGLRDADIVYEAVAEGGITRFNALYHDNIPANLGPVRSLRPYYIDWFWPFDAAIVHAGGSPEALQDVRNLKLKDIDHGANGSTFRRVSNRYAPHNLYTSGTALNEALQRRGYTSSTFTSLVRKVAAPAVTPTAKTVNLRISSALYNVVFTYDATTNTYNRAQGGGAHVDADTGKQINPSVVIVPVMTKGIHPDRVHTTYGTIGSGKVYIFQDGLVTEGTWSKSARNAQWQLLDAAGATIPLNPGQTWFTMIDKAASVSYTP